MKNNSQLRPRFSQEELAFIDYALTILEQLSGSKIEEQKDLPSQLRKFAKLVYFTGWTVERFEVWKDFKVYVECEMKKNFLNTHFNAHRLKRRIRGLLNGRRYHSTTLA